MRAWKGIGLRTRVYGILGVLIALMMAGGIVTMWYVSRMNRLFGEVIEPGHGAAFAITLPIAQEEKP